MSRSKLISKNNQIILVLIFLIFGLVLTIAYQVSLYFSYSKQSDISLANNVCNRYNLNDELSLDQLSNSGAVYTGKSPLEKTKVEMEKFNLFQIISTIQSTYQNVYESGKLPYNSWTNALLGSVWIGDGSNYSMDQYREARMLSIGYFNLSYEEAINITAKKFHQIDLCNYKQILEKNDSPRKDMLLKNGLTLEKINARVIESEKNSEQKKLRRFINIR